MMLHTLNRTWQLRSLKSHAGFGHVPYKFRHGTFGQCKRRIRPFESTTTHAEGQQVQMMSAALVVGPLG